jgi:hypothetical protein
VTKIPHVLRSPIFTSSIRRIGGTKTGQSMSGKSPATARRMFLSPMPVSSVSWATLFWTTCFSRYVRYRLIVRRLYPRRFYLYPQTPRAKEFLVRTDAVSQTVHAGTGHLTSRNDADRLGATYKRGKLQGSGRRQGVVLADLRSSEVQSKEGMAQQSVDGVRRIRRTWSTHL